MKNSNEYTIFFLIFFPNYSVLLNCLLRNLKNDNRMTLQFSRLFLLLKKKKQIKNDKKIEMHILYTHHPLFSLTTIDINKS